MEKTIPAPWRGRAREAGGFACHVPLPVGIRPCRRCGAATIGSGLRAAAVLLTILCVSAQPPLPQTRAGLISYAAAHPKDTTGALALLALGITEMDQKQFAEAIPHFKAAGKRLPKLADYAAYLAAASEFELHQFHDAEHALAPVFSQTPPSPLNGKAAVLGANAYLQDGNPRKALDLVARHNAEMSEAQSESLLAHALEAQHDAGAAAHYRKVYLEYPLSTESADAEAALARIGMPPPAARFARAQKLMEGGDFGRARRELEALAPQLTGADRDLARVLIGSAMYRNRDRNPAWRYLETLEVSSPEADARRLYLLIECARRLDRYSDIPQLLAKLQREHPKSKWRMQALIAAGDSYSQHNEVSSYRPLFQACYDNFGSEPEAEYCHWRVTWADYLATHAGAEEALRLHVQRWPDSDKTSTALYFLGRIAESKKDWAGARAYYSEVASNYPNYFYAVLSRERLKQSSVASAQPSETVRQFLAGISFGPRKHSDTFDATPTTRQRIERARLLASAGLDDLADSELRFGARTDGQPQVIALELAEMANRRDAPEQGIRLIKHFAPGYMLMPVEGTPDKFWRLAFPLPFRQPLELYSREHALDPYLVAALIRQESEFNPKALSRARAYGLTQVMPATGREVSRKLKMGRFNTAMLYQPDVNLRIGTWYLRAMLDQLQGRLEPTLASYNAGKSRVVNWLHWSDFREPAEFIESIPFNETRNYVQSVLRNADIYRRLYAPKTVALK
ncbi:MAG: transglycosylase SLT domain-containing protein [Acidobacteriota bacterium]|nr:transglycosylase SLT domain-containing protein [Acidobacteriota bacterium]